MQHYAIKEPLPTPNSKREGINLCSIQEHLGPELQESSSCLANLFVHSIGGLIDKLAGLYKGHGPRIRHNTPSTLQVLQLDAILTPSIT